MKDVFTRLSRRSGVLVLVALAATGVGVAVAAIPGGDGTITGCANRANGALRVIDKEAGQTCSFRTERELSWNQTGLRAYAFVRADGSFNRASSVNVASVRFVPEVPDTATTDGNPPTYCVAFTFKPTVVVATAENFGAIMGEELATNPGANTGEVCQANEVMIRAIVPDLGFIPNGFSMMAN